MSAAAPFPKPTLLHNPKCTKSRAAKAWLDQRNIDYEERRYLEQPLSVAELAELRRRLDRPAREWVRSGEDAFKAAGLSKDADDGQILAAMAKHPILIERPILILDTGAAVGRPTENIEALLRRRGR
jgi:arsenate reductase (glutaredoxin)